MSLGKLNLKPMICGMPLLDRPSLLSEGQPRDRKRQQSLRRTLHPLDWTMCLAPGARVTLFKPWVMGVSRRYDRVELGRDSAEKSDSSSAASAEK